jgi:predicted amidohydrolase YtcJ
MNTRHFIPALLGLLLGSSLLWAQAPSDASLLLHPDMIIYNAKIVTMDDASFSSSPGTITQAMAIRGDEILDLGTDAEIRALAGPSTNEIDAGGRTIMPNFIP